MQRRQLIGFLGAALALPFLPRGADAAIELGESLHRRLLEEEDIPFRTLNPEQRALVSDIAELIIPETDTPGAKKVKVPEFIDLILTEWAGDDERAAFLSGLADIDTRAVAAGAPRFVALSPAGKQNLLTTLDGLRREQAGAGLAFSRLKRLTVFGYFTSKPVQENVLKTRMFFDGYHGNVPFTPAV